MSEDKYSVIITAFEGDWGKLQEAVGDIFGREGLDVFSLVLGLEMPSEVAANLPEEEARRISTRLEPVGAKTKLVLTSKVTDVKHRCAEVWSTYEGEHFVFTEIDGMTFSLGALNAKECLDHLRGAHGKSASWTYERSNNHYHVDIGPVHYGLSRETIREGNKIVAWLKKDLETCYPNTRFVIAHDLGTIVSYYHATEDAPKETIPADDRSPEKAWCPHCEKTQPHNKRTEPDTEFPEADWGDCAECGNEVLVAAPEVLILIGPEQEGGT